MSGNIHHVFSGCLVCEGAVLGAEDPVVDTPAKFLLVWKLESVWRSHD